MKRRSLLLLIPALTLLVTGCAKPTTTTPPDTSASESKDLEGREVVDNWKAGMGDVTVCPISGKRFEVDEHSGHFDYQGYTFVFCCDGECLDKVKAEPGKYLDALVEQAGGPVPAEANPDPDDAAGTAIDDGPDDAEN